MAVPYPPEWADEELMAKSVMDEPRSLLQKAGDFVFGRTPSEKFTNAFTSLPMAKYDILHTDLVKPFYKAMSLLPKRLEDVLINHPTQAKYVLDKTISEAGDFNYQPNLIRINPEHPDVVSGQVKLEDIINHETTHWLVGLARKYGVKPPGLDMPSFFHKQIEAHYKKLAAAEGNNLLNPELKAFNEYLPIHLGGEGRAWNMKVDYPSLQNTYQSWWPR